MDDLDPLYLHRYRARFRLLGPLRIRTDQLGVILRGAFGLTLRGLVCHDLSLACVECSFRRQCSYPSIFDPGAREDRPKIVRIADPPRPFVLRPAHAQAYDGTLDAELAIDLHVVGRAHAEAPVLFAALQRVADNGIGRPRVPLSLEQIDALDAQGTAVAKALDPREGRLRACAPALRARDFARPGDDVARRIRIRYLTPTLLRADGALVSDPAFGTLIRRLRARLGALATTFCDTSLGDDAREVGLAADEVKTVTASVQWRQSQRRSSRTGQKHFLGGFVGESLYEGNLARFLPMLRLAESLHVGRHATFGLGRIEVDVLS